MAQGLVQAPESVQVGDHQDVVAGSRELLLGAGDKGAAVQKACQAVEA